MQTELTQHLSIQPQRCLNSRSADEFCRRCVDICPEKAIAIAADGLRFDASQCHECALCVIHCPTGAYRHTAFSPGELLASLAGIECVNLHCQFSGSGQSQENSFLIPCHGLLTDRLMAGMQAAGVNSLHLYGLDRCETCPSRVGARHLAASMENAAPALAAHFPRIEKISAAGAGESAVQKPDTSESAVGRRGFLGQMAKGAAYVAISTLPGTLQADDGRHVAPGQQGLMEKHLPDWQQLAADLHAKGISESSWLYQLEAHDTCDACNICSHACPTGSLCIEESGQVRSLLHKPAACVGCGLCISLCPQQALQFCQSDPELIRNNGTITLIEYGQGFCDACGAAFVDPESGTNLCPSCEKERAIQDQWLNM